MWAQALVALILYPAIIGILGSALFVKVPNYPKLSISQLLFLSALMLLVVLAEIQGNSIFGWAPLKADALRHSASTWLLLAYSVFCMWVVRNRDAVVWVLHSLIFIALLHIMAGVAILASGIPGYFLRGEFNIYTTLQGAFFNKNSFAAFLNLALFPALGLYVLQISHSVVVTGEGWRKIIRMVSDFLVSNSTRLFFVITILFIALLVSNSRAGFGLSVFGACVFFGSSLLFLNRASVQLKIKLKGYFSIFLSIIVGVSIVAVVLARLLETSELDTRTQTLAMEAARGSSDSTNNSPDIASSSIASMPGLGMFAPSRYQDTVLGRIQPALDGLNAIRDSYWFGVGANNFQWVFMPHRTEKSADGYYKYAHSDGIQFLIESGIIGLLLYGIVLTVPLYVGCKLLLDPVRSTGTKSIALGCMIGIAVVFAHSFIDFPFQIFGVVLPLITLLNVLMILAAPPKL